MTAVSVPVPTRPGKMTEEEFLRLPDDGRKYEFVDGEAKEVPTQFDHDVIGAIIITLLAHYAKGRGFLTISQAGFRMTDKNLRCPDVAFTRKERLPNNKPIKGFPDFAPDLCIEIISPSEEKRDMMRKVEEYFASGASLVWHVFPEAQQVIVYTSPSETATYDADQRLDAGDLLPGFSCLVSELFVFE